MRRLLVAMILLGGCAAEPGPLDALAPAPAPGPPGGIVAVVDGEEIASNEVLASLLEASGATILEEVILDRSLERLARAHAVRIAPQDLDAERIRLVRTLQGETLDDERVARLIETLRRDRGLGPVRFEALVRRNALLRALVRDEVTVSDEDIRRAFAVVFGERIAARLIVVPDERLALEIRARLSESDEDLVTRFSEEARRYSVHPSGEVGGKIEPVSPVDPAVPEVLRLALATAEPATMTPVLGLDGGYAIALVERRIEPEQTTLDAQRPRLMRVLRARKEREAMGDLARRLLDRTRVQILDRSLAWSWERRAR